jgi:hypothetical protein
VNNKTQFWGRVEGDEGIPTLRVNDTGATSSLKGIRAGTNREINEGAFEKTFLILAKH